MKKIAWNLLAAVGLLVLTAQTSNAQTAVLSEMYGRGVHAYYSGMMDESLQYLTMAIDNSIQDPRAYYFRGMVYEMTGRPDEAEADWKSGAKMEAAGRVNGPIGKSLARLQGSARLKLESIRQKAKLEALATAMKRSKQRYGELESANAAAAPAPPTGTSPVVPPPVPPTDVTNPFADDLAQGEPEVVADDAFKGAMKDPFEGEAAGGAGTATPPANNPFGGGGAGADPFGGAGAGGGADPFGGAGGGAGGADPFGGAGGGAGGADPFGGAGDAGGAGGAGGADPFGGAGGGADPFGGAGGGADPFGS